MPGGVTFAFDKAEVQPQFYPVLDNVAGTLQQYNQTIIEVDGHTDSVDTDSYNQQLSQQRAEAVANYLNSRGVISDRMITVGAGETRTIASKYTATGRSEESSVGQERVSMWRIRWWPLPYKKNNKT